MVSNRRSTNKEDVAEKRAMALRLRKDGHSYNAIGRMLGTQFRNKKDPNGTKFTEQYASKLVHDAIKDIYREDSKDLVRIEMERLDAYTLECLDVLRTEHVLISSGCVVHRNILDKDGKLVFGPNGLPKSEPILDDSPKLAAIDRLLKIQERRARLLGLDKPTKVAPTNPNGDKPAAPAYIIMATPEDQKL